MSKQIIKPSLSICLLASCLLLNTGVLAQSQLRINGRYKGEDLIVQNPFSVYSRDSSTYCIDSLLVNGVIYDHSIRSSAFKIKLDSLGYKIGDSIAIVFFHRDNCKPRILLDPHTGTKSSIDFIDITLDTNGLLTWSVKGELNRWIYIIEQFRWNKWVKCGEVNGIGEYETHSYRFNVKLHSGKNKVRVKFLDLGYKPRYSLTANTTSSILPVTYTLDYEQCKVTFSDSTQYEMYDEHGNIIKKGEAINIDITDLKRKKYYLNLDAEMTEIKLKKSKRK